MDTHLEFHLRHGQAMHDLREAVASTPSVSLGPDGEMLLTFTKPDGALVTAILRDIQEQRAKEKATQPALLDEIRRDRVTHSPSSRQLKSRGSSSVARRRNSTGVRDQRTDGGAIG